MFKKETVVLFMLSLSIFIFKVVFLFEVRRNGLPIYNYSPGDIYNDSPGDIYTYSPVKYGD